MSLLDRFRFIPQGSPPARWELLMNWPGISCRGLVCFFFNLQTMQIHQPAPSDESCPDPNANDPKKKNDSRTHTFPTPSNVFWVTISFSNLLPPPDVGLSSLGSTPPQVAGISALAEFDGNGGRGPQGYCGSVI